MNLNKLNGDCGFYCRAHSVQKLNQLNWRRREIHQDKDLDKMLHLYLYSKYLDIWTFLSVFWLVHVDFCRINGTFIPPSMRCLINKIYLRLIFLNYYKMTSNFDTIQSIHSNVRYLGEEIHFDLIFKCFSVDNQRHLRKDC